MGNNESKNDSILKKNDKTSENNRDNNPKELQSRERDAKFAYEKLLQIRNLDNQLLWTRINILIVFQGVLIAAIAASFDKLIQEYYILFFVLIAFGFFSSVVLHRIATSGSWWVSHWEEKLRNIEYAAIGNIEIFRNHPRDEKNGASYWKEKGYISIRNTVIWFTFVIPILWGTFLIISIAIKFYHIFP